MRRDKDEMETQAAWGKSREKHKVKWKNKSEKIEKD